MAQWKKVIVSGSQAELNSLALDTALPVSSGGTGTSTLTDGGVLLGSGTGAVTALGQAANGQLVIGSTGADPVLSTLTQGANITITNSAGGIEIAASGLTTGTVTEVDASGTVNGITLTTSPAGGITETGTVILGGTLGSITNTQLSSGGNITLGSTVIALGAAATTTVAGLTSVTSIGFTGTLSATSVLADGVIATTQAPGDDSTKVATTAYVDAVATAADLDLAGDGGTTTAVDLDSQTLTFTGQDGLQVSASAQTITATIADDGITNAKLANPTMSVGGVTLTLGGTDATPAFNLSDATAYPGDSSLVILGTVTSGDVSAILPTGVVSGSSLSSPNQGEVRLTTNGVAQSAVDLGLQETDSVTFGGLSITNDAIIGGDLTVNGTTTSINTANLDIEDQFILLNSGSSNITDSGIVFGGTNGVAQSGAAAIWDASYNGNEGRLAIVNNMASDATGNQTPSYHIAGVLVGTEAQAITAQVDQPGNIRIESDEIYIYI